MDHTAIQAGSPPSVAARSTAIQNGTPPVPRPQRVPKGLAWRALEYVASLKITVTLFALSLFLVFYGTLAQTEHGVWTVVAHYFRSFYVLIPLDIVCIAKPVLHIETNLPGYLPYPGGWLLGSLLLVNLVAAHIVSFKLNWRRSGIVTLHAGVIVMMLGELITGMFAVESHMHINEHGSASYVEQSQAPELAVVDASDLKKDQVTVIPTALLRKGGVVSDPALPFDVDVRQYLVNSILYYASDAKPAQATHGQGKSYMVEARPEGTGVDRKQRVDQAAALVEVKRKGTGESLGRFLLAVGLDRPDAVTVDGKEYQLSLRFKRVYTDYTFRLDKLTIEYYPNTDKPKDYASEVHLTDPKNNEQRDVRIWMNHPFTYRGETFYQSSVHEAPGMGIKATTLQVVSNPGWMMPYLSCLLVSCGMLFHFGQNLYRFVERRAV